VVGSNVTLVSEFKRKQGAKDIPVHLTAKR